MINNHFSRQSNVLIVGKKKVVVRKQHAIGDKKNRDKANYLYSFEYLN
jgi:hypothetical protein